MSEVHPDLCGYRSRLILDAIAPDGRTRVTVSCRIPLLALPDWVDPPVILHVRHSAIADGVQLFEAGYRLMEASDIGDLEVEWSGSSEVPVLVGIHRPEHLGRIVLMSGVSGG
jgi:hypothetical protein